MLHNVYNSRCETTGNMCQGQIRYKCYVLVMKYTLSSSTPLYIFYNHHKILNNIYIQYISP